MSLSISTARNTLLAEARTVWRQQAQTKAVTSGAKVQQVPTDTVLISQDVQLAQEIKKAEAATETASTLTGSILNVLG